MPLGEFARVVPGAVESPRDPRGPWAVADEDQAELSHDD